MELQSSEILSVSVGPVIGTQYEKPFTISIESWKKTILKSICGFSWGLHGLPKCLAVSDLPQLQLQDFLTDVANFKDPEGK